MILSPNTGEAEDPGQQSALTATHTHIRAHTHPRTHTAESASNEYFLTLLCYVVIEQREIMLLIYRSVCMSCFSTGLKGH